MHRVYLLVAITSVDVENASAGAFKLDLTDEGTGEPTRSAFSQIDSSDS